MYKQRLIGNSLNKYIIRLCPSVIYQSGLNVKINQILLYIFKNKLYFMVTVLKYHFNCQFKVITELTASDYPEHKSRFSMFYLFYSLLYRQTCSIKTWISELDSISTIVPLFNSANWFEREAWDMFGIYFVNHPDLRRILTDYGFMGFPLRKDFPLSGYVEIRYYDKYKKIIYSPVKLIQDFRKYDLKSPWNYFDPKFK